MKLAYIISVYKDPQQLKRLIDSLDTQAWFFIHVDKKVDVMLYKQPLKEYKRVIITTNRYFINWGSFGQALYQKELLRLVIDSGIDFDRVICLSGQDYPLWSNTQIINEFNKNKNKQYILGYNLTKAKELEQRQRITVYHFFRDFKTNYLFIKRLVCVGSRLIMKSLPIRKRSSIKTRINKYDIYMGSDYWSLSFDCAKFVYYIMSNDTELMNYFKFSWVPSEMWVQTIVFNSKFAINALNYSYQKYEGLLSLTPLHHIQIHNNKQMKIFTEKDYDVLINSGKMFFRKSSTGISDLLIKKLEKLRT